MRLNHERVVDGERKISPGLSSAWPEEEKSFLRAKQSKPVNKNDVRRPRGGSPGVDRVCWFRVRLLVRVSNVEA